MAPASPPDLSGAMRLPPYRELDARQRCRDRGPTARFVVNFIPN